MIPILEWPNVDPSLTFNHEKNVNCQNGDQN
jgi:hypothetical protein